MREGVNLTLVSNSICSWHLDNTLFVFFFHLQVDKSHRMNPELAIYSNTKIQLGKLFLESSAVNRRDSHQQTKIKVENEIKG